MNIKYIKENKENKIICKNGVCQQYSQAGGKGYVDYN